MVVQLLCLYTARTTLRCPPPLCCRGVTPRRGGGRGEMARSDRRRAQANTDLQWKALGSRSRLPGGCSACSGSIPASGVLLAAAGDQDIGEFWGTVRMRHGEVCSGRVVMKRSGLDTKSGLKTPVTHSGEVSEGKAFSGYTFFYPFPKPLLGTGYRIGLCWLSPAALLPGVKTGKRMEAQ